VYVSHQAAGPLLLSCHTIGLVSFFAHLYSLAD
jgi:hypothetical protein